MSDGNGEIDRLLARLDAEGHGLEEHPASERLSAYQAGELPAEERAAVQTHLEACSLCRERLADLEGFLAPRPEAPAAGFVADFESAAEWRRLREQLSRPGAASADSRRRDERSRLLKSLRLLQALAALLGTLLVGLSLYTLRLQGNRGSLQPIPDQPLNFYTTRGPGNPEEIKVRLPVGLRVQVDPDRGYSRYRVEIREPGGRLSFASDDYSSANVDSLTLPLLEGSLNPGTYTVELFGLRDGHLDPIASTVKLIVQP